MGYNREQYNHLQKTRRERRKYEDTPMWKTESMYVDTDTGEIILKRRLENGEYVKIKYYNSKIIGKKPKKFTGYVTS